MINTDPNYKKKALRSFYLQSAMKSLQAELIVQGPGVVSIKFPYQSKYTQQNGYIHAGILSTILDSACGYAAYTLMPPDADVLTVEFKVNLLRPAKGEAFEAKGIVLKAGRTLSVVEGTIHSSEYSEEKPVATMTATIITIDTPHKNFDR